MNIFFFIAGILCFVLGLVHSFLGEYLIFNDKRKIGNLVPSKVSEELKERHLRIIWATWHLASFFGWCLGAILVKLALVHSKSDADFFDFILTSCVCTMFTSSILVLVGTKGKHPGWIVFLLIGILLLLGR